MMKDWLVYLPLFLSFAVITASYALFPYISRKTLSFGITIPENASNDPSVVHIRTVYRNRILLSGAGLLLAFATVIVLAGLENAMWLPMVAIAAYLLVFGAIYLDAYRKMKHLKASLKEWHESGPQLVAIDTAFRKMKPQLNPWWFSLNAVIVAVTILITLLSYDVLPDRLPTRFNTVGQAVAWMDKSAQSLMIMPLTQIFISVVFFFAFLMMSRSRPQIDPANREKTLEQNVRFRFRWTVLLVAAGILLNVMMGCIQLSMMGFIPAVWVSIATILFTTALIVSVVVIAIMSGQSGNRIRVRDKEAQNPVIRDDDRYWKWGMFYHNPDDPSVFIEKRVGIGWTMNWARPLAWIITLGLIAVIAGYSLLTSLLAK